MNTVKLLLKTKRAARVTGKNFGDKKNIFKYIESTYKVANKKAKMCRLTSKRLTLDVDLDIICLSLSSYSCTYFHKSTRAVPSVRKVCALTGRSRGLVTKFKLSRMVFKELSGLGFIAGVKRAS